MDRFVIFLGVDTEFPLLSHSLTTTHSDRDWTVRCELA